MLGPSLKVTTFLFIEAPPPSGTMPGDWAFMYICMLEVSIFAFVAKIFGLEFGTVLAVWYTTFFLFYAHLILIHFFQSNVMHNSTCSQHDNGDIFIKT